MGAARMWTDLAQVGVLCTASDRDSKLTGQLPDYTRPMFGSAGSPEGHPARRWCCDDRGVDGREPVQTDPRPAPSPPRPWVTLRGAPGGKRFCGTGPRPMSGLRGPAAC